MLTIEESTGILTTASRYLVNNNVRDALGITSKSNHSDVIIRVSYKEFDVVLEKFWKDFVFSRDADDKEKIVSSRSKKPDWIRYGQSLVRDGYSASRTVKEQRLADRPKDDLETEGKKDEPPQDGESNGDKRNRDKNHPDTRKHIIPSNFHIQINDDILNRIYRELKSIEVDNFPVASAAVLRCFLENVYDLYHTKSKGQFHGRDKNKLLNAVISIIEKEDGLDKKEKQSLAYFRKTVSNAEHELSPKNLGSYCHGAAYPIAGNLKIHWDNISAILLYMLKRI